MKLVVVFVVVVVCVAVLLVFVVFAENLIFSSMTDAIVTGAGDETLRFWNVFPGPKTKGDASDSSSMLDFQGRTAIR